MPCELTADTYFDGTLASNSPTMTYEAGSSFKMNSWCDMDNLSYSWTYEYMDQDSKDADDTLDYRSDLAANMTSSIVWTEQESDYQIDTFFTVSYNSTEW